MTEPSRHCSSSYSSYCRGCRCRPCKDAYAKYKREWMHRKAKHGNSYPEYLARQDGVCAICGTASPGGAKQHRDKFVLDHDHDTGEVRGLLCHRCNLGLGLLDRVLPEAIAYLASPPLRTQDAMHNPE